jgi:hypothetical protein
MAVPQVGPISHEENGNEKHTEEFGGSGIGDGWKRRWGSGAAGGTGGEV